MPAQDVLLRLDKPEVTVDEFIDATRELIAVMNEVASEVLQRQGAVRWVIAGLNYGSATLVARGEPTGEDVSPSEIASIARAAGEGLSLLELSAKRPRYFSDRALAHARALVRYTTRGETGTTTLRIGEIEFHPTQRAGANVDELIAGTMRSIGSVEGVIEMISRRRGYAFAVRERVHDRRVRCDIPKDLLRSALDAFEHRVIASGTLWSRRDGTPVRIEVESLSRIPPDAELPRSRDVRGVLAPYGEMDHEA